jgi:hypothetical protein
MKVSRMELKKGMEKNEARRKVFLRYSWFLAQKKML